MSDHVVNRLTVSGTTSDTFAQIKEFVESEERALCFDKIIPMPRDLDILAGANYDAMEEIYLHWMTPESEYSPVLGINHEYFETARMTDKIWWQLGLPETRKIGDLTQTQRFLLSGRWPMYNYAPNHEYSCIFIGNHRALNRVFYGFSDWGNWRMKRWGTPWDAIHSTVLNEGYGWIFETVGGNPEPIVAALSNNFPNPLFTLRHAGENGIDCKEVTYQDGGITHVFLPGDGSEPAIKMAKKLWDEWMWIDI